MVPEAVDNTGKYGNYREQFTRLKRAVRSEFYLEAVFIEYSIIEDRSEAALRHAGRWEAYMKSRGRNGPTLESKIKRLIGIAEEKKHPLHRSFTRDFSDQLFKWKEERNDLIHALLIRSLTTEYIASVAIRGEELAKKFCNIVTEYKRKIRRKNTNTKEIQQ